MKLALYLGSKCNLNCAYCHREKSENETPVTDKFLDWLESIKPDRIKFYGGEPLIYINDIKKVVNRLPNIKYAISTNGKFLKQFLPYFKEHNFHIAISFDGENSLRGFDPFTELIEYPNLACSCTLYHGNTDLYKLFKIFQEKEKIIGRSIPFYPHLIHITNEVNAKYALTKKDIDSLIEQIKDLVMYALDGKYYNNPPKEYKQFNGLVDWFIKRYNRGFEWGETYCFSEHLRKIDTQGNQYSCLYIRDNPLTDNWLEEQQALIPKKCKNCKVYSNCGGGCIKSKNHDLECYYYYTLFSWFNEIYPVYLLREKALKGDKNES